MVNQLHQDTTTATALAPLPNFIGIGAQRAATTWLHECLAEHPDVFVPPCKELDYFVQNFHEGIDWYRGRFAGFRGESAVGEITPTYLGDEVALSRIAETVPKARLFVVLRNPIDRTFSAYQLFRSTFGWATFSEAIRRSPDYLLAHSLYASHLQRAYQFFPKDRVKIFLYDDIEANPTSVVADLYRYLGVDHSFVPQAVSKRYNRIVYPGAQKLLRSLGLGWAISLLKRTPIVELIKKKAKPVERPRQEDIDYLREFFQSDVDDLGELIGRDVSHWLTPIARV